MFPRHTLGCGRLPLVWFSNKSVLSETKIAWRTCRQSALSALLDLQELLPKLNHATTPLPRQSRLFPLKLFPRNRCLWIDQDKWSGSYRKSVFCCPHKGPGGKVWLLRVPLALITGITINSLSAATGFVEPHHSRGDWCMKGSKKWQGRFFSWFSQVAVDWKLYYTHVPTHPIFKSWFHLKQLGSGFSFAESP